jgi:hydroxylamine reductase
MHAMEAGKEDTKIYAAIQNTLTQLAGPCTADALVGTVLGVGGTNVQVLAMLDAAHTTRFGTPTPTPVNHSPTKGKAILISGHDLTDLEALLQQSLGKGVNVYTHGEMLPAHGYPGLKGKYPHLVGNFGGAWQLQKMDFAK